jgi:maltose alpha-D-glucosyltransferase/alpha-amylase
VLVFWLGLGVDGLRLDAVPYLCEREGTNCENLPATHAFLKTLRRHVDQKFKNRMLLAEANQWPEDAIAYFYEAVNVENQQNNTHSLLWWMKRLTSLRKRYQVFGRDTLELLAPENRKILAFLRRYRDECILVVANLSRFAQCVELDLAAFQGIVPLELFGRSRFLPIGELPYALTLGPHSFYWFALEPQRREGAAIVAVAAPPLPMLSVMGSWEHAFQGRDKAALEAILPNYLKTRRWFGGKARTIQAAEILESVPIPYGAAMGYITLIRTTYTDAEPETYVLPLAFAVGEQAAQVGEGHAAIAHLRVTGKSRDEEGILYDGLWEKEFAQALLGAIARGRRFAGAFGEVVATPTAAFRPLLRSAAGFSEPSVLKAEQSNTSVIYGDLFILKLFRRPDGGINPDLEIGRFLTEVRDFRNIAPLAGALEYRRRQGEPMTLAILQSLLPNKGDAWQYTLDTVGRYFEDVLARQAEIRAAPVPDQPLLDLIADDPSALASELIGLYLEEARLLGQRTGELHVALAQDAGGPNFVPEPFSDFSRRSLYQGMLSLMNQIFPLLRRGLKTLPETAQPEAYKVLEREGTVRSRFQGIRDRKITAMQIRCHGDYHLGQVLHTGKDFIIIDFEGEPARPLSVRRLKRSPLRDVAGMLRSFGYAAYAALLGQVPGLRPEDFPSLEPWARFWYSHVSVAFLRGYLAATTQAPFLPHGREDFQVLLDAYLLEKAIYELGYELNNRPDWVRVPLAGILHLLEPER